MEIKDLNNLQPITWGLVVMLLLVTIVPGYLLIFLFNEQLFLEVDTVKLLFLSVSFTMPLWSLNTFVCFFNKENDIKDSVFFCYQHQGCHHVSRLVLRSAQK